MATYKDKLDRILKTMQERTGLSNLMPGTKAYQMAEAYAFEQMLQEADQQDFTTRNSIAVSSDKDLDEIGRTFFRVPRLDGIRPFISSSMKALKFYVEGGNTFGDINSVESGGTTVAQDINIPEGTIITGSKDGIVYRFRVTKDAILSKDSSEQYVDAELIQGPLEQIPSNILKVHDFTSYSQSVNKLLKITNPVPINSGRPKESDDNYRFRISNALRAFPKTTMIAIHQLITEMPGVSSAYIVPASNGGGTFTAYVQGTTPITDDTLIEDVSLALSQIISPWQIAYTVVKPNYIGISASISITLKDDFNISVTNLVTSRISDYLNNFNGNALYVNSILSLASSLHPDILDVSFNYVRIHTGSDEVRSYTEVDLESDTNPVITIESIEKLISEPIPNAILVTATV